MPYNDKSELDKIEGISNICDRILLELDDKHPWNSIIRYLVIRLKNEYGEK